MLVWEKIHEPIVRDIWGHLEYEQYRTVEANDVIVDAGASIGIFTVKASIQTGKSGVVYAFEPNPENFLWLKRNTANLENVKVFQKALWSSSGVKTLYVNDLNFGGSSLYLLPPDQSHRTIEVETTRLDDVVRCKVDFLKIDVEASEPEVLKGAVEMLRKSKPFIAVEIHNMLLYHAVNEYLTGFGYEPLEKNPTYGTLCWR